MENSMEIEKKLESSGLMMVQQAREMRITSHADYENAAKVLVDIKTRVKQVKDYWKKPKADAASAHRTLCDRENEMLRPLSEAEKIIKNSMVVYQAAIEAERRKAEEEARRRKQEEVDRLLAESMKAEEKGNAVDAATNMAMAQMIDDMPSNVEVVAPKASGTSIRKTWKARVVDPKLVPAYISGIEVREIKMSALNQIAKMTNGTLDVPGVEWYEEQTVSVRT